jgi:hypothetical protein
VAHPQVRQPADVTYPAGHPTPYDYDSIPPQIPDVRSRCLDLIFKSEFWQKAAAIEKSFSDVARGAREVADSQALVAVLEVLKAMEAHMDESQGSWSLLGIHAEEYGMGYQKG